MITSNTQKLTLFTEGQRYTTSLGRRLAKYLTGGDILLLFGELGSGKTTFVRGLARGLGIKEKIKSPTFILIGEYRGRIPLYHFDLYRIKDTEEFFSLGYEDYFFSDGITVVEWPEKIEELLKNTSYLLIYFFFLSLNKRKIVLSPHGSKATLVFEKFRADASIGHRDIHRAR